MLIEEYTREAFKTMAYEDAIKNIYYVMSYENCVAYKDILEEWKKKGKHPIHLSGINQK